VSKTAGLNRAARPGQLHCLRWQKEHGLFFLELRHAGEVSNQLHCLQPYIWTCWACSQKDSSGDFKYFPQDQALQSFKVKRGRVFFLHAAGFEEHPGPLVFVRLALLRQD
jgi:hypothetical protein